MGVPRFTRPKTPAADSPSSYLYVANCGPAVGLSYDTIASVFNTFGEVKGIHAADESGTRVIVSYFEANSAEQALTTLNGKSCADLDDRSLHIRYSVIQPNSEAESQQVNEHTPVSLMDSEVNIPGLYLVHDFLSPQEEKELLAAVDERPWISLTKRRVQHYGYEFCYGTRNVDTKLHLGELPSFVSSVLERISSFPALTALQAYSWTNSHDNLQVNEYPPGVGLSPHIDTHSAFEGLIFSLSLAGPCIMEFRRYLDGSWVPDAASSAYTKVENVENCSNLVRRSLYLPPRSILLLSGEARYAWQHYIPHHKIDMVNQNVIRRGARRVSFTFRKVLRGPCRCEFQQYCDSER